MKDVKIALLAFLLNLTTGLQAQKLNYVQYTTDNGLPSSEVYDVLQDSSGYIWFATDNGVSRFNGYEFENFSIEDGLPSKVIFKLYLDPKGILWFINDNFSLSYYKDGEIHLFEYNNILHKIKNKKRFVQLRFISDIRVNNERTVLINFIHYGNLLIKKDGTYKLNERFHNSDIYIKPMPEFKYFSSSFPIDKFSIVYKGKIFLSHPLSHKKHRLPELEKKYKANAPLRFCMQNSNYIFSIGEYLYTLNSNGIKKLKFNNHIISLYPNNGVLWVGMSNNGIAKIEDNKIKDNFYLRNSTISSIYTDNENNMWLTAIGEGVYCIPNESVKSIPNTENLKLKELEADLKNEIIVSSEEGFVYKLKKNNIYPEFKLKNIIYRLKSNDPIVLIASPTESYCLSKNSKYKKIVIQSANSLFEKNSINDLYLLNDSIAVIANGNSIGIAKYIANNEFVIFTNKVKTSNLPQINQMYMHNDSTLLACTKKGLLKTCFNTNTYEISRTDSLFKEHELLGTRIDNIIYNSYDQKYWLNTKERGILIYDHTNNTVENITKENGLFDSWVTSIIIQDSIVWASTKLGLNKIEKNGNNYKISCFGKKQGLPANEINDIVYKDPYLYFTSPKGLHYFNPKHLKANKTPPPIYITGIKINEKDTSVLHKYELKHSKQNLIIKYIGLGYKPQGNLTYKYRMVGIDTSWQFTTSREVRFPQLQPKKYTFEVMAQNEDGYWSKEPAKISFTIKPPYWETWWFRLLLVCFILLVFWLVFQYRMREIRKRNLIRIEEERKRRTIEKNLTQTKQKLVTQQLNPHFLFNTMSSIQYMIINNQKMEAVGLLSKFARMMRQGLEYSRVEYASLEQSIEFFKNYIDLKSINLEEKIEVVMDTSKINSANDCSIPPMLIQPFVENAIIHGLAPKKKQMLLKLSFSEIGKNIKCIIEDNGIGRKQSAKIKQRQEESYESFGVKIINETLEMMNTLHGENYQVNYTDLIDENNEACGTRVEISFPKFKN